MKVLFEGQDVTLSIESSGNPSPKPNGFLMINLFQ